MHPQLQAIRDEFTEAQRRLHVIRDTVPEDRWRERANPNRWSIAECVGHLNLTTGKFEPTVHLALGRGRRMGGPAPRRYRRNLMGWLLWRTAGPPVRFRVKTPVAFVPRENLPPARLMAEFDDWQSEQLGWVDQANGLPLDRLQITSPFDSRVRYNLYACLSILPRHQHRHLWQAEQVWRTMRAGSM